MSERLRRARPTVLAAALVAVVAALALPASGLGVEGKSNQACELSVFSWWTGGGEAAGLTKLIAIWNRAHPDCKFKNETVAGGAGTNAKAVLAQRLAAGNPPDSFQGHAGAELRDYIKAGQVLPIDFIYKQAGFGKSHARVAHQPDPVQRQHLLGAGEHPPGERPLVQPEDPQGRRDRRRPNRGAQFIAALQKAKDAGLIPLAMGEQWTAKHLLETVMIGALGPKGWAALWRPNWQATGPARR